jgi:hypothetical protein
MIHALGVLLASLGLATFCHAAPTASLRGLDLPSAAPAQATLVTAAASALAFSMARPAQPSDAASAEAPTAATTLAQAAGSLTPEAYASPVAPGAAAIDGTRAPSDPADIIWIPVLSIRPMQFDVGMRSVAKKADKYRRMTPQALRAFLVANPIPVIAKEDGSVHVNKRAHSTPQVDSKVKKTETRPNDHHHESRAAWEAGIRFIAASTQRTEDASTPKKEKKFWKKMKRENQVYLRDRFGEKRDPADLPMDVRGLGDNPYRSLAGDVRDAGGYTKNTEPFSEFRWAEFFRKNLTVHPNDDYDAALKEAMKLAKSKKARDLPGYNGKK